MKFAGLAGLMAALVLAGCEVAQVEQPTTASIRFDRTSEADVAHGERLAQVLGCKGCHAPDLTGVDWSDTEFGVLWTANLTRSAALMSPRDLEAAIRQGVRPGRDLWAMPSHIFTQMSDGDMSALIAYLRSVTPAGVVHPQPTFEPALRELIASDTVRSSRKDVARLGAAWPPDLGESHALARYAIRATCAECHGMNLRGEEPPFGGPPRPDLRIAAAYSREEFQNLMRTGASKTGRELELMGEVAQDRYSRFTEAEVDALYAYFVALAAAPTD